jgi:hypothetical protein
MFYYGDTRTACPKPECGLYRYEEQASSSSTLKAKAEHYQLPLRKQLAFFLLSEKNENMLKYKATRRTMYNPTSDLNGIRDVFDGEAFKIQENRNKQDEYNLVLSLYYDGFQPFDRGNNNMAVIMFTINNLPPEVRWVTLTM